MLSYKNLILKTTFLVIALFWAFGLLCAQEFKILDINTDEYPIISARYVLTEKSNKKVTNLTKEEIRLIENNTDREIIFLKNPEIFEKPLSILLVFDISGSMKQKRMVIAKEAAHTLIDEVDLSASEIAISTFNYDAFLNCDFSHDAQRLKKTINNIEANGGTSYDDAFLADLTGGIEIAKNGMFKKIIIFMTDGLGNTNADSIVQEANKAGITIFTAAIELDMPPVLKKVSKETGGYFFEQIEDPKTSKNIYKNLYRDIVATEYGVMKWEATEDCEDIHHVKLTTRGLTTKASFEIPIDSIEGLIVMPQTFFIRSQEKDSTATKFIRLASPHKPITITNIISTNPNAIQVELPDLPLELSPGTNHQLKVNYSLKDTSDSQYDIKIYTENCLERSEINIQYGIPGKIEVIAPVEGDIFGAGMDTVIRWRGVSKNQPVKLYYRNGETNWQNIGIATGLSHKWSTPFDTSCSYQILAKPADATDFNKKHTISGQLRDIRIMDVSNDGSMFITKDQVGLTNVYQIGISRPIKTIRNIYSRFVYFSKDDLSLINYGRNSLSVSSIFTNGQGMPFFWDQFKVFAVNSTLYGDEFLFPAEVINNSSNRTTINHISSNKSLEIEHDENTPLFAAICSAAPYALWMNRDYSLDFYKIETKKAKRITKKGQIVTKAYINPNGTFIYIEQSNWKGIIESNRGKPILNLANNTYIRFSPQGNYLLTIDTLNNIRLWDLEESEELLNIPRSRFFNFSFNEKIFYYAFEGKVAIYDVEKKSITRKLTIDNIEDISIAPDGSNIIVTSDGKTQFFNCHTGNITGEITNPSSPIQKSVYAGNNKILTITKDKAITVWAPSMSPEQGLSGQFSVVSPLPDVAPHFNIGKEMVGHSKEVILDNFVTNNSDFPIQILQFEWENYPDEFELVSNPPPFSVSPGESKDIEIRFNPSDTIIFPTSISVITPGGNVPSKITGQGIDSKFKVSNKIIDFGKIKWKTQKDSLVTLVKNISNEAIFVESIINTGPDKEQFIMLENYENKKLLPGQSLEVKLQYSALHRGRASGGLTLKIEKKEVFVQLFGEGIGLRGTYVKGKTIDQDSTALQTNVICTNLKTNRQIYNEASDSLGNFGFWLNADKSYILFAEKQGYISGSENIDLTQPFTKDTTEVTITLSKIEQGSLFRLNGVFFEFAKAELIQSSKTDLDRVLLLMQNDPKINLEVHGHTDEIGTHESNLILSKNRANAVKNYLIENGIDKTRISIQYFGETRPVATNETDEGRQLNRRVEFLIKD